MNGFVVLAGLAGWALITVWGLRVAFLLGAQSKTLDDNTSRMLRDAAVNDEAEAMA